MKRVDYVVDGGEGEEEIFGDKRGAIKRAHELADLKNETIRVLRWFRPDQYSDLELDEGFDLEVSPKDKEGYGDH